MLQNIFKKKKKNPTYRNACNDNISLDTTRLIPVLPSGSIEEERIYPMFAEWTTFVSENLITLAMFERYMFCMHHIGVRVIVFNATFNNISWRSVLLVEEPEYS